MGLLVKVRRAVARGPLGSALRKLGLVNAINAATAPLYSMRHSRLRVGDVDLRFKVSNHVEAARVAEATDEMSHIESFVDELRDGDVFYDVGANIGMFSCAVGAGAARKGLSAQVHAFEPEPRTASRLSDNLRLNDVPNARIHRVALSDSEGELELRVIGGLGSGKHSLIDQHTEASESGRVRVPVHSGAAYAQASEIDPPTLMKVDVEGAEGGVIRGAREWISDPRLRRLDVEYHVKTLAKMGEDAEAIERIILDAGMRLADTTERGSERISVYRRD